MRIKSNLAKGFLAGLLVAASALVLMAGVSDRNLVSHQRTRRQVVSPFTITSTTWENAGNHTVGFEGSIMRASIQSQTTPTWTSSIGAMDYPARLDVRVVDEASDSAAITCTNVTIYGNSVLGTNVTEVIATINESENLSKYAYESVDYVRATGCAGLSSDDYLVVKTSDHVGLRQKIRVNSNILSVCRFTHPDKTEGNETQGCNKGTSYTINAVANSVDLTQTATTGLFAIFDEDTVVITVKGTVY